MIIGCASVSLYDLVRFNLNFDTNADVVYFNSHDHRYNIKLNAECLDYISQNKKFWITLTDVPPGKYHDIVAQYKTRKIIDVSEIHYNLL